MWKFSKNTLKSVTTYVGSIEYVPHYWSCPKLQSRDWLGSSFKGTTVVSGQPSSHTAHCNHMIKVLELWSVCRRKLELSPLSCPATHSSLSREGV